MVDNFVALRNRLKKEYPEIKVHVRRVKLKDCHGTWQHLGGHKYLIKLHSRDSFAVQMDTLMHEWAHVVTHSKTVQETEHTMAWGKEYAKVYQIYEEYILND